MMTAKPYKKRLLYSLSANAMEVDTSDGNDRDQTPSPSSQEELEKDNNREPTRPRKGWKKKICRKQFRHHDIEIFKPGTNPTTCMLKKKESSPTIAKKLETPPSYKESITDSIVNTLGGQKSPPPNHVEVTPLTNHAQAEKSKFLIENTIVEENNNRSENNANQETVNTNGRHHLPAIVNEICSVRRKSIDVGCGAKVSWTTANLRPGTRRSSIDMPLLTDSKPVEVTKKINCNREDKVVREKDILKSSNEKVLSFESNAKISNREHMERNTSKTCIVENPARVLEPSRNNLSITKSNIQNSRPTLQKMKYDMSADRHCVQDLSYHQIYQTNTEECSRITKRRMSEVPVDLSIKTAEDVGVKNAEDLSITSIERSSPKMSKPNVYGHEKVPEHQWFMPSTQILHGNTFNSGNLREVLQSVNSTNFRKIEEEMNFHITKINNIFQKDFSTNNLRKLSQSYLHLNEILKNCYALRPEIRAYIENILNHTFRYFINKLKYVNLEPIRVLKILGTPETTPEKADMMEYLNKIFHQAANLPIQITSNNIQQRDKVIKSPKISPNEKAPKLSYQKKIEELKRHLPPYNTLPPNLINSVTLPNHILPLGFPTKSQIDQINHVSSWRYNQEMLTPSPTSPNVTFRSPPQKINLQQKQQHNVDQPPAVNRPNSLPNMDNLELNESATFLPDRPELFISPVIIKPTTTKHPKEEISTEARRYLDEKNRVKTIRLGSVIVADTSMQITKESAKHLRQNVSSMDSPENSKDTFNKEPQKMNIDPLSETGKNKTELEFLNIIQKLKSEFPEEKMTELLLHQLQETNKKRKVFVENPEPIEINDSDSEDSRKGVSTSRQKIFLNRTKDVKKKKENIEKRRPENLEITTKTKLDIETKIRLENNRLAQNFTPTSVQCTVQKTVYSPEIEPISPVDEEVFQYPDVTKNNITLKDNVISYQKDTSNKKKTECKTESPKIKRQKSEDANSSARVAPHGKLCYVREHNIFLRYFDESQAKLFIENSVSRGDASKKEKTILNKDTPPSEKIQIPPQVEFSHKEDIPEPIEFVRELRLVEQFVPKDFAAFYRFVTGYQIVRNKNPVSLQTFLLMYNTNGIAELLKKYLNTTEGDQMVPI